MKRGAALALAGVLLSCSKASHAVDGGAFTLAVPGDWTYAATPPAVMMTAPKGSFQCLFASRDTGSDGPSERSWDEVARSLHAVSATPLTRNVAGLSMKGVRITAPRGAQMQSVMALVGKRGTVEFTVMVTDGSLEDGDDFTDTCLSALRL